VPVAFPGRQFPCVPPSVFSSCWPYHKKQKGLSSCLLQIFAFFLSVWFPSFRFGCPLFLLLISVIMFFSFVLHLSGHRDRFLSCVSFVIFFFLVIFLRVFRSVHLRASLSTSGGQPSPVPLPPFHFPSPFLLLPPTFPNPTPPPIKYVGGLLFILGCDLRSDFRYRACCGLL